MRQRTMADATMADATADALAMDAVLSSRDLLTVCARALARSPPDEALLRARALSSARCACKAFSLAFGDEKAWEDVTCSMLRTKSCRYIDCIVEVMQGNPHRFVNMAAPLPRLIKGCLESGLAKKWLSLFKALMEDGQRQQLDEAELQSMCFDFRYRVEPDNSASDSFRFESVPAYVMFDPRFESSSRRAEAAQKMARYGRYSEEPEAHVKLVMNHPNELDYEWAVEENGTRVKLGLFPKAWVRRLPDWRWVIANINIVLIECDPEEPFRFPIPEEHFAPQSATQMVGLSTGDSDGSDVDDRWPEGTHPGDDYYDGDLHPYHENGSSSEEEYEDDSGSQSDEED